MEDKKIGLFYGSDTGFTEEIVSDIIKLWDSPNLDVFEGSSLSIEKFNNYEILIIGLSTWYDGDLQSDWESFYDDFKTIDFTNKTVAIFGLGDQIGYPEYFVDGIGIIAEVIFNNGGNLIGFWPIEGYRFTESKALYNDQFFYGLAIDEDNQPELTQPRLEKWIKKVKRELEFLYSMDEREF
jgi:flavodoxin I